MHQMAQMTLGKGKPPGGVPRATSKATSSAAGPMRTDPDGTQYYHGGFTVPPEPKALAPAVSSFKSYGTSGGPQSSFTPVGTATKPSFTSMQGSSRIKEYTPPPPAMLRKYPGVRPPAAAVQAKGPHPALSSGGSIIELDGPSGNILYGQKGVIPSNAPAARISITGKAVSNPSLETVSSRHLQNSVSPVRADAIRKGYSQELLTGANVKKGNEWHDVPGEAMEAYKKGVPVDDFLDSTTILGDYNRIVTKEGSAAVPGKPGIFGFGGTKGKPAIPDETRPETYRDLLASNKAKNPVSSKEPIYDSATTVSQLNKATGVATGAGGGADAALTGLGYYGASAMFGIGATAMAEGGFSMEGITTGAVMGVGGGIVGRMAAGSLQGGFLNQSMRGTGSFIGDAAEDSFAAGMRGTIGSGLTNAANSLSGMSQAAMTNTNRAMTFAGAGLAGFSMGRDRDHSRGFNSGRGNRF
jgi:hypothetical protein